MSNKSPFLPHKLNADLAWNKSFTRFSERCVCCRRRAAIRLVMQKIPEPQVRGFYHDACDGKVSWLIPDEYCYGFVDNLPPAAVIYLSPTLESGSMNAVMGAVAHEISHYALGHLKRSDIGPVTEHEADDAVRKWGLGEQLDACYKEFKGGFCDVWREFKEGREKKIDEDSGQA